MLWPWYILAHTHLFFFIFTYIFLKSIHKCGFHFFTSISLSKSLKPNTFASSFYWKYFTKVIVVDSMAIVSFQILLKGDFFSPLWPVLVIWFSLINKMLQKCHATSRDFAALFPELFECRSSMNKAELTWWKSHTEENQGILANSLTTTKCVSETVLYKPVPCWSPKWSDSKWVNLSKTRRRIIQLSTAQITDPQNYDFINGYFKQLIFRVIFYIANINWNKAE